MQFSIVKFSEIDLGNRTDAEYFQPTYLHIENKLAETKSKPLRVYCSITGSAFYPAATHLYEFGDLPFIRCVDCIHFPTITKRQDISFEKIPSYFANEHKNIKRLAKGDIVITKVGTPCYSSIVHDIKDVALSRTVLGLRNIRSINPYYLTVFLRSKYGFLQLYRERELTIQYQLTLERVGNVLIYQPEIEALENAIADALVKYEEIFERSEEFYKQAQSLLLSELNLLDWQPKHRLNFVKNYRDTQQGGRFDAEYFQPKYDEIINAIKNYKGGWNTLENLCELVGHPSNPPYAKTVDKDKTFIVTQKHLGDYSLNDEFWKDEDALYTTDQFIKKNRQYILEDGDVLLYSVGAYIGKANIFQEEIKATIGSFLTLLRAKQEKLNPYYLMVFLNTDLGVMISKQHQRGMAQQYLYPYDIRTFPIPLLKDEIQKQIQEKITESFNLRKQSKHLLECAKKAVEMAIEKDEKTAMQWLKKQTQKN
jgi:restriction endonuclease S subunit